MLLSYRGASLRLYFITALWMIRSGNAVLSGTLVYGRTDVEVHKDGVATRCNEWSHDGYACIEAQIKVLPNPDCSYWRTYPEWHTTVFFPESSSRQGWNLPRICNNFCYLSTSAKSSRVSSCGQSGGALLWNTIGYSAYGITSEDPRFCGPGRFAYGEGSSQTYYNGEPYVIELGAKYANNRVPKAAIRCGGWNDDISRVNTVPEMQPVCERIQETNKCGQTCNYVMDTPELRNMIPSENYCWSGNNLSYICMDECTDHIHTPEPTNSPTEYPTTAPTEERFLEYRDALVPGRTDIAVNHNGIETWCTEWRSTTCYKPMMRVLDSRCPTYSLRNRWHQVMYGNFEFKRACPNFCFLSTSGASTDWNTCKNSYARADVDYKMMSAATSASVSETTFTFDDWEENDCHEGSFAFAYDPASESRLETVPNFFIMNAISLKPEARISYSNSGVYWELQLRCSGWAPYERQPTVEPTFEPTVKPTVLPLPTPLPTVVTPPTPKPTVLPPTPIPTVLVTIGTPESCADARTRGICEEIVGCQYDAQTGICHENPCASLKKKKCRKNPNCTVNGRRCVQANATSCSGMKKKKCKAAALCSYNKKKKTCFAN